MFYPAIGKAYDAMAESGYIAMKQWDGRFLKKVGQLSDDSPGSQYAPARNRNGDIMKTAPVDRNKYPLYFKQYRIPNHPALNVLWVMRFIERFFLPLCISYIALLLYFFGWEITLTIVVIVILLLKTMSFL